MLRGEERENEGENNRGSGTNSVTGAVSRLPRCCPSLRMSVHQTALLSQKAILVDKLRSSIRRNPIRPSSIRRNPIRSSSLPEKQSLGRRSCDCSDLERGAYHQFVSGNLFSRLRHFLEEPLITYRTDCSELQRTRDSLC